MLKTFASVIALVAVAAAFGPAHAGFTENGLTMNGLQENGLEQNGLNENGLTDNGLEENGSGVSTDITRLQALRLVMPDGTELVFH